MAQDRTSDPVAAPAATEAKEQPSQLEDIVVTARRRNESLLNVPVAVTAISREALDKAHITNATQIAQMTPNLLIGDASGGGGGAIAIRGVGSSFIDPGIEQSVGIVIDGVSMGRGRFILLSQFDLQQVEVLKGPQALFFGKNSPAGVISITSAEPTRELSGMIRGGYEFEADERYLEGNISGPITNSLLFRLAGKYSNMTVGSGPA
jgi:outer membrane receptor protein involved in Fe transport